MGHVQAREPEPHAVVRHQRVFGKRVPTLKQINGIQQVSRFFEDLRTRAAIEFQRQTNIFANSQGGNQVEELENKADLRAPEKSAIEFR